VVGVRILIVDWCRSGVLKTRLDGGGAFGPGSTTHLVEQFAAGEGVNETTHRSVRRVGYPEKRQDIDQLRRGSNTPRTRREEQSAPTGAMDCGLDRR
jgi:hypothetical protein